MPKIEAVNETALHRQYITTDGHSSYGNGLFEPTFQQTGWGVHTVPIRRMDMEPHLFLHVELHVLAYP